MQAEVVVGVGSPMEVDHSDKRLSPITRKRLLLADYLTAERSSRLLSEQPRRLESLNPIHSSSIEFRFPTGQTNCTPPFGGDMGNSYVGIDWIDRRAPDDWERTKDVLL